MPDGEYVECGHCGCRKSEDTLHIGFGPKCIEVSLFATPEERHVLATTGAVNCTAHLRVL